MIRDLSNADYHAHPAISSSDVKTVAAKSLAHWKGKVYKQSPAFALGSAVHAMVLEPQRDLVLRGPEDRRGNKWKEAQLAADMDGKILLTEADHDLATAMSDPVKAHPVVSRWLAAPDFVAEASFFAKDPVAGIDTKCRPDGYIPSAGIVFDIKTTQDASPDGFPREVRKYGYDLQAAFYLRCLRAAGYMADTFMFVCIEKDSPYAIGLHELTIPYLAAADMKVSSTLQKISNAISTDDYTTGWPLVNSIDLPRWQTDQPEADIFDDASDF